MRRLFLFLLILAGCTAPPTQTPVPILRVTVVLREATPTAGAPVSPTPEPENSCPGAPVTRLIVNQRARVLDADERPLNIRSAPGTDSSILSRIPPNEVFYVLAGPQCADGYLWYFVRYRTFEGWIAEGDNTSYFVEPFLTG
jgi:hypothetical protein